MFYRQYKNRLFYRKCGRGGLVFNESSVRAGEKSKGLFGGEGHRGVFANAGKTLCAEWQM